MESVRGRQNAAPSFKIPFCVFAVSGFGNAAGFDCRKHFSGPASFASAVWDLVRPQNPLPAFG